MSTKSTDLIPLSSDSYSQRRLSVVVPMIATFTLFVLAAFSGSYDADPGLLPITSFISLLSLIAALVVSAAVGLRYANRLRRRVLGLTAAGAMGLGAGFIGSASAFGAGFSLLILGMLLGVPLVINELNASLQPHPDPRR